MDEFQNNQKGKQNKHWDIYYAVISLEIFQGHLNWTYADVARAANVHRTLIYHYFGKNRKTLFNHALIELMLSLINHESLNSLEDCFEIVKKEQEFFKKYPLFIVYLMLKNNDCDEVSQTIYKYFQDGVEQNKFNEFLLRLRFGFHYKLENSNPDPVFLGSFSPI